MAAAPNFVMKCKDGYQNWLLDEQRRSGASGRTQPYGGAIPMAMGDQRSVESHIRLSSVLGSDRPAFGIRETDQNHLSDDISGREVIRESDASAKERQR